MSATSHWLRTFAILLLAPLSLLHAADWPQWGGTASKNMVSAEKNLPETFVPGEKGTQGEGVLLATTRNVKWAVRIGDFSCGTPTVAGGKVFIAGMLKRQGVMNCFDEATGRLLWQWIAPCRSDLKADAMNFRTFPKRLGICSTPVVDGDRLYFVDQNCLVICLSIHGKTPASGAQVGQPRVIDIGKIGKFYAIAHHLNIGISHFFSQSDYFGQIFPERNFSAYKICAPTAFFSSEIQCLGHIFKRHSA